MTSTTDVLTAARYSVSRGWPVFPLHGISNGQCTCGDPGCGAAGKHPATRHGHLDATLDLDELEQMFPEFVTRNVGIATGATANLAVIDIDPRNGGFDAWDEFERVYADLDLATHTISTGGGGLHLYYSVPPDTAVPTIPHLLRGIDLKADGGYVVAPPSLHTSGSTYQTANARALTVLPDPFLEIIRTGTRPTGLISAANLPPVTGLTAARQREILRDPSLLGPGERDTFFTFTARDLRRGGYSFEETVRVLGAVYERMHNPPGDTFTPEQMIAKVRRAFDTVQPEITQQTRDIARGLALSALSSGSGSPSPQPVTATTGPTQPPAPAPASPVRPEIIEPSTATELVPITTPAPPQELFPTTDDDGHGIVLPEGWNDVLPAEIFERWDGQLPDAWLPNDDGLASLAFRQWGHRLRFNLDNEDWLVYDSTPGIERWVPRAKAEATEMMKHTIRSIVRVVVLDLDDDALSQQMIHFATRSLNDSAVRAALRSLSTHPRIRVHTRDFDADYHVLPVENGVIEPHFLGESYEEVPFRPHRPEDLFTRHANLVYDSHPISPVWEDALARWFPDLEVRLFAQRLLGYAVFGSGQEKTFVVAHGQRDSGKSAFFNNVRDFLGTFAITMNVSNLLEQRFGQDVNNFGLAHISGARLLLTSESGQGAAFDAEKIKVLTSGGEDVLHVRALRENFTEVRNKGLIVIMTNHIPRNNRLDEALWGRLVILPFTNSFPPGAPGTIPPQVFKRMLHQERDGVLRWLVEGYANYTTRGLDPPPIALAAIEAAREEQDWVAAFADACLNITTDGKVLLRDLYLAYENWCRESGEEALGKHRFSSSMSERFPKRRAGAGGAWHFHGCELRAPVASPQALVPESWRNL